MDSLIKSLFVFNLPFYPPIIIYLFCSLVNILQGAPSLLQSSLSVFFLRLYRFAFLYTINCSLEAMSAHYLPHTDSQTKPPINEAVRYVASCSPQIYPFTARPSTLLWIKKNLQLRTSQLFSNYCLKKSLIFRSGWGKNILFSVQQQCIFDGF